jgi:hypothetical protein
MSRPWVDMRSKMKAITAGSASGGGSASTGASAGAEPVVGVAVAAVVASGADSGEKWSGPRSMTRKSVIVCRSPFS